MLLAPAIRPVQPVRVHVGGAAVLGAVEQLAAGARRDVLVDAFRIDHRPAIDALGAAAARGVAVSVLANSRELDAVRPRFGRGVEVDGYGGMPAKQHSKSITVDGGARGLVGTDVLGADALDKLEFGVEVEGAAAAALRALEVAARRAGRDPAALRAAADGAAALGIVANEPVAGVRHASRAVDELIAGARERLLVVSRSVDDPAAARGLADAARRGVRVDLVSYDELPEATRRDLERAGAHVHLLDKDELKAQGRGLHGLQLVADGQALVSGAYLLADMLRGTSTRQSRELGVLLDGDPARVVADAVAAYL